MVTPRIFYLAGDHPAPSGGEISIYEHVDVLNDAGLDAYALHTDSTYRHTWFPNQTRTICFVEFWRIFDETRDYFVVPEQFGPATLRFPGRKVIFNKNLYHGFNPFRLRRKHDYPYTDASVVAAFANSAHNVDHLRFAFPDLEVFRMYPRVDRNLFRSRPLAEKRRRICCVSRALPQLQIVCHLLWARSRQGLNNLAEYDWVIIEGYSQQQVADLLQDSLLVIALNAEEGLPRVVLQALSCGCLVLSQGAGPLLECLPPQSQFAPHDLIPLARRIEAVAADFPRNIPALADWVNAGQAVAEEFTCARQAEHLLAAWNTILALD